MKARVLRLYKDLLRYGQSLQFTDRKYFKYRIKKCFLENQNLDDVKAIEFCIKKGQKVLDARRVV